MIYCMQYHHLLYSTPLSFCGTATCNTFWREKQTYFDLHSFRHQGHIKIRAKNSTIFYFFLPSYLTQLGKHCANGALGEKKSIFA